MILRYFGGRYHSGKERRGDVDKIFLENIYPRVWSKNHLGIVGKYDLRGGFRDIEGPPLPNCRRKLTQLTDKLRKPNKNAEI